MDPQVLLLDEPELGLDIGFMKKFEEHILTLNEAGKTFIIASHDLDLIQDVTHRIALLDNGNILRVGKTEVLMPEVRDFFGL
jgi:ABC-type multidrug transport system ATPase subunit